MEKQKLLHISVCVCVCRWVVVCVDSRARVALIINHATRRHTIILRNLWLDQIFRYYLINDTIVGKSH